MVLRMGLLGNQGLFRPRFRLFQQRWNTNSAGGSPREPSPHVMYYRNFARPIAKVVLFSLVSYYGLHLLWWQMDRREQQDIRQQRVDELEHVLHQKYDAQGGKDSTARP